MGGEDGKDGRKGRAKEGLQTTAPTVTRGKLGGSLRRKTSTISSQSSVAQGRRRAGGKGGKGKKKSVVASEEFKGISFGAMLMSIRFARRWGDHFRVKRAERRAMAKLEPTYRLEPPQAFRVGPIEILIEKLLTERLEGWTYSPKMSAILCRAMTEELKDALKKMSIERYKYIVVVNIGQRMSQGVEVASRCAWDDRYDNFASASFVNAQIWASAQVFAVYVD